VHSKFRKVRCSSILRPMRTLVVFWAIYLFAIPVRAEVYTNAFLRAEAGSVSLSPDQTSASVTLAVTNSTAVPYSIVLLSAVLKDNRGHFFEPAGRPRGIPVGRPFTCERGVVLAPGGPLIIEFSFRVPARAMLETPTLNFSAEFQAQRQTCENFTVSLANLSASAE
jgi:hypothetical protein